MHIFKEGDQIEVCEKEIGWNAYHVNGLTATITKVRGSALGIRINPEHIEELKRRMAEKASSYLGEFMILDYQANPFPSGPCSPAGCLYGRKLNI